MEDKTGNRCGNRGVFRRVLCHLKCSTERTKEQNFSTFHPLSVVLACLILITLLPGGAAAEFEENFPARLLATLNRLRTTAGSGRVCNSTELTTKAQEWIGNIEKNSLACGPDARNHFSLRGSRLFDCYHHPILPYVERTYGLLSVLLAPFNVIATQDPLHVLEYFDRVENDSLWEFEYTDAGIAVSENWIGLILGEDVGGLGDFCVAAGDVSRSDPDSF